MLKRSLNSYYGHRSCQGIHIFTTTFRRVHIWWLSIGQRCKRKRPVTTRSILKGKLCKSMVSSCCVWSCSRGEVGIVPLVLWATDVRSKGGDFRASADQFPLNQQRSVPLRLGSVLSLFYALCYWHRRCS